MRATFTPKQVRNWGSAELGDLLGKYVVVETPASDEHRKWMRRCGYPDHDGPVYEGGAGTVTEVLTETIRGVVCRVVVWDYGMQWQWPIADGAWVSVCDEHGSHEDGAGRKCVATLGVRGATR